MKTITISDGIEEYRLNDRVTVRFNPTDIGFLEKLSVAFEKLDRIQEEVRLTREKITDEREVFPLARELDARMRGILNDLFADEICTPLFGGMNLFASSGGLPVWANLMLAIADEVQSTMADELDAREARIAKYVAKYSPDITRPGYPTKPSSTSASSVKNASTHARPGSASVKPAAATDMNANTSHPTTRNPKPAQKPRKKPHSS